MQKAFNIQVDIEGKIKTPIFEVNTNDLKAVKLTIAITRRLTPVDLTGITVRLAIRKPDNNVIFQDCTIKDAKAGLVEVLLENQAYITAGTHTAEVMCYKGQEIVSVSGTFTYKSLRGILNDEAVESKSEFTAITNMLRDVEETIEEIRENGTGVDAQARQGVEQVTAQLAETAQQQSYFMGSAIKDLNKPTRGIITFFTDDANTQDYTVYKPLFKQKGIPFTTGVITSRVGQPGHATKEQLLELQADGHEITSHTKNHPFLADLTADEIDKELRESKQWLLDNGFTADSVAYPYGSFNEKVKEIAKKYYRAARCSDYGLNGLNDSPLETFEIKSTWLDSNVVLYDNASGFMTNTFEYYKYHIDKAFEKNSWLVISSHSWNIEEANLSGLLGQVIDYAKSKCDILTFSKALDKVGNIIETGSFTRNAPHHKHFAVGYDGRIKTNNFDTVIAETNAYTGSSHIDEFEDYKVTVNRVNTVTAQATNLPEGIGGLLYTYKIVPRVGADDSIYNYQTYHVLITGNVYKRVCNAERVFGEWKQTNGGGSGGGAGVDEQARSDIQRITTQLDSKANKIDVKPIHNFVRMPTDTSGIKTNDVVLVYENMLNWEPSAWEVGSLSGSAGTPIVSTNRIRTKDFIPVEPNVQYKTFDLTPRSGSGTMTIIQYDEAGNFINTTSWQYNGYVLSTAANTRKIKLIMQNETSTDISVNAPSTISKPVITRIY